MNNNKSVSSELAEEAVNSIEEVAGKYPGYRRAHAKGVVYQAVFTPNGQAGPLTTAPHLQNHEVQALVRFSNSSTNPSIPDVFSPAKGMAVQFVLPDGGVTSLVTITLPIFLPKHRNPLLISYVQLKKIRLRERPLQTNSKPSWRSIRKAGLGFKP